MSEKLLAKTKIKKFVAELRNLANSLDDKTGQGKSEDDLKNDYELAIHEALSIIEDHFERQIGGITILSDSSVKDKRKN